MASIMDMFRNFGGAPAPATTNSSSAGTTPPGAAANPTIPNNANANKSDGSVAAIPAAPANSEQSPLANFEKMWEVKPEGKGNETPSLIPRLNMDPTKLSQAVSQLDFTKTIPQELMAKAMAGNDPASLIGVINLASQAAFQHGIQATGKMIEESFGQQANTLMNHTLPSTMQSFSNKAAVASAAPIMNNPAVAPLANLVREQFTLHNPLATSAEVAGHVTKYFDALGQEFLKASGYAVTQAPVANANSVSGFTRNGESDFSKWA